VNQAAKEISDRIVGELNDMELVVKKALRAWEQTINQTIDKDLFLDSVALNLQNFYSGLERLFELIAKGIDDEIPTGQTWHRALLRQIAMDKPAIRPAVISESSVQALDEYRRFRHLVRNVYSIVLLPDRLGDLIAKLPEVWLQIQQELRAFADFLQDVATKS
jgi:hypothetical protein